MSGFPKLWLFAPTVGLALLVVACTGGEGETPTPTSTLTSTPTPGDPARFSGTVTIDGEPAFDGATVIATVNGLNCGVAIVGDGTYAVDVTSDIAGKEGCGKIGDTVVFVLGGAGDPGGQAFDQTGVWDNTKTNELDLTLTTSQ